MFISVLFPAPFSPTRAKTSPLFISKETLSFASTPGNCIDMFSNLTIVSCKSFTSYKKRRSAFNATPHVRIYLFSICLRCYFLAVETVISPATILF